MLSGGLITDQPQADRETDEWSELWDVFLLRPQELQEALVASA